MKSSFDTLLRFAGVLTVGYVLVRAIEEFYLSAPGVGSWLGRFSLNWAVLFIILVAFCLLTLVGVILFLWFPGKTAPFQQMSIRWRQRLAWIRWPIAIVAVLLPTFFLLYTSWGSIFSGPYLRLLLLLTCGTTFGIMATRGNKQLLQRTNLFLGLVLVSSIFVFGERLTLVTTYPFSLSWSEGNRLYDYSLYVDPDRYLYSGELVAPRGAFGRNILWGILFAIPDTPIWLHRLWDAILWTVPYIVLGSLLARKSEFDRLVKWTIALWLFLFLLQGPIYTPLILCIILVVLFVSPQNWILSLLGVALASYYASASRWTWVLAPTAWAVLIMISGFKLERGEKWLNVVRRLIPIAIVAAGGLIGGMLANAKLFSPRQVSSSTSLSQPLLWSRLLPNTTYNQGILWGLILAAAPLVLLLLWLAVSKRWPMNWLQGLAYSGAPLVFLAMGLVASVKIGGGSNLHNLDMLLVTLAVLTGLMLWRKKVFSTLSWPAWALVVLVLAVLLPSWHAIQAGGPLQLPPQESIDEALDLISTKATKAQQRGEVLFIDQRQLLTFGYIEDISLVPEYEKKFMMDQAMASNASYFEAFYQDLAKQRFSLIITEPLYLNEQDLNFGFEEENNAWVRWVARPLLCYYAPVATVSDEHFQLLVPRENPKDCP